MRCKIKVVSKVVDKVEDLKNLKLWDLKEEFAVNAENIYDWSKERRKLIKEELAKRDATFFDNLTQNETIKFVKFRENLPDTDKELLEDLLNQFDPDANGYYFLLFEEMNWMKQN